MKETVESLKSEKLKVANKYESLRETFKTFKDSMADQEDPKVLRLALNQCRKDLTRVTRELNELKHEFSNPQVVSQVSHDLLQMKHTLLEKENQSLKEKLDTLAKMNELLEKPNMKFRFM